MQKDTSHKCSDLWIEQGGIATGQAYNATAQSVTFKKNFTTTNYTITLGTQSQGHYSDHSMYSYKTVSGFRLHTAFNASSTQAGAVMWKAVGY